jgi:hypothetical protein
METTTMIRVVCALLAVIFLSLIFVRRRNREE